MTRGGINFIYTPLCGSIAYKPILDITYKLVLSNPYKVEMLYMCVSIACEVILNYCQKVG